MQIQIDTLTPELFLNLYRSVGWEAPGLDQIKTALDHSTAAFCVFDGDWDGAGMFKMVRK